MKFISYYTKDTPYEDVMNNFLLPSLDKWNLNYEIKAYEDRGNWQRNTAIKSEFIKEMILKNKESIVFIDSDAIIVKDPKIFSTIPSDIDIGYFPFNWAGHWRNQWNEENKKLELLSGTMFWNYNNKTLNLLDEWTKRIKLNINIWEQKVLEEIVFARDDLNIFKLPAEYCCVLMHDDSIPKYIKEPVIIHTQASRKYKYWHRKK